MTGYTRNDTSNNIATGNVISAADLDGEFDAIVVAFNNSSGHTHDGTSAEGAPITVIGPSQDVVTTASEVRPKTNNALDLGTLTYQWKNFYVDGIGYIDSLVADTADINGGTIDATVIGGTTPAAGSFTTLSASGTFTLGGTAITATATEINYLDGVTSNVQTQLDALSPSGGISDIAGITPSDSVFIVGDGTNWVGESGATVRASLGLTIGTNVQAYDAGLQSIAGLTTSANKMVYTTSSDTYATTDLTSFARTILDDGDAATVRTTLGLTIGTNVQAYDAGLASIAGLTTAADQMIYATGSDTYAVATLTAAGRALLDDADAAAQRTTLGLGTAAVANLIDEDDMASDSATAVPSQQSVKAYVDANSSGDWTESAVTATTSGTAIDFTSLPSGIKEIEIWFDRVSASSSDDLLVQVGTGGSPTTSGYEAGSGLAGTAVRVLSTAGFPIYSAAATYSYSGVVRIYEIDTNDWVSSHTLTADVGSGSSAAGGGAVTLAGTLDNVRLTSLAGSQTFDAGQIRVRYR